MKANDLRIGNLTKDKLDQTIYEIDITTLLFISKCNKDDKELSIEEIPLTEEWLLNFEFNFHQGKFWIDGLCVHTTDSRFYIIQEQGRVFIRNVHHLQNLYFALTGKELSIKIRP